MRFRSEHWLERAELDRDEGEAEWLAELAADGPEEREERAPESRTESRRAGYDPLDPDDNDRLLPEREPRRHL